MESRIKDGFQVVIYESGWKYEGELRDNKRYGKGVLYDECGDIKYEGEWKNNKKHGKGILYYYDKRKRYEGDWKFGERNGYGI
jgi:hypothetical protein